ncbi:hypothetical protein N7G274_007380 [Stereocaulon virgatum]|uniref:Exoribonuclease phosphorolytic domain-containing protein n=1 Tax=Stereocaulon virgatum TaxID=373712 RepID=A0ABR4A6G4_9LECA
MDRRRVNGPPGGTAPPVYLPPGRTAAAPGRTRGPNEIRKIFLKTGLTPSAAGSAYLELETPSINHSNSLLDRTPALKLTCTVHGPRPLPRSSPFSPRLLLSTRVKFAPFAARQRRGYIPDSGERDLAAHLETALRGILIGGRWPKSGVDVIVTVLEGEEDCPRDALATGNQNGRTGGWGMMSILSGCITVASAALTDAGIDCVDIVTGGIAAIVRQPAAPAQLVLDPCPPDHEEIIAACVIGYLQSRDEVTETWAKGNITALSDGKGTTKMGFDTLIDHAVEAAMAARRVLVEALKEGTEAKIQNSQAKPPGRAMGT